MLNLILVIITNSILFPLKLSCYLDAEPHASCEFFNFLSLFLYRSPWPAIVLDFFSFPFPSVPSGLQPSSSSFFYFFIFLVFYFYLHLTLRSTWPATLLFFSFFFWSKTSTLPSLFNLNS
ncbi:hypothetical protein PRUPE_4G145000 [Prunus persica]|uniref:Uncharacterized protein n=1 Tax=Prunus persica TaxID=3760 RepID=A0A251PM18_PRUPE|nr:hypothetical protein PRUPE_4G145000 [Prunus persica]